MNTVALIEEVKGKLHKLADASLLDENSMYREIVMGMKEFGNDVMAEFEEVIEVKNGKAELPDNFMQLRLAALCEPLGYEKDSNIEYHDLQTSYYYRERVINSDKWNECDPCCREGSEVTIKENLYFKNSNIKFYYHKPQLLSLGKSFSRGKCSNDCRNKLVRDSVGTIDISGRTLHANFKDGYILVRYFGLPIDEEGRIEIPETFNGYLEKYLELRLLVDISTFSLANDENTRLSNLLQIWMQERELYKKRASNELKMSNLSPHRLRRRIKRLNSLERLQYEIG